MSKKDDDDNHANQGNDNGTTLNHNNPAYKGVHDNRSKQLNPNSKSGGSGKGGDGKNGGPGKDDGPGKGGGGKKGGPGKGKKK